MSNNNFEHRYKDWHQKISFMKSGIRLVACLACIGTVATLGHMIGGVPSLIILAGGLAAAEVLGIIEEWI